ncbi:dihydrofolate reductase-like [Paramacrobiotus metropolitanus]|uniref:dihydrofolate reductase-like n=1 Tax=Paramacrobiotus metropolitanus TaxID=2943436 RepID=UPI002445CBE9|nr:dihydrofolate reductase-like [Paramacrobiotus metropolitanus]
MAHHAKKFNLIVAACENGGIGNKGGLPWTLKGEMKQFARLTTESEQPNKKNAVIMGRKTWFSIPEKNRPLKNRINVVVTNSLTDLAPLAYQASSMEDALSLLCTAPLVDEVDIVWIIGGQSLYQHAFESAHLHRVYLTKVHGNFECDAFFPLEQLSKMEQVVDSRLPQDVQSENGIEYQYQVFQTKTW